ncbi:MAG: HDOD domain-containing protein [Betaproteobacteria bacterium]|nr:HDOD domain-containing protein [Betaproteobacteria bacterium]
MSLFEPGALDFPLISLQPVTDSQHAWRALLLAARPADSLDALPQLFGEYGLSEALGDLPCVIPLADPASLAGDSARQLPAGQIIWLIPAAQCADSASAGLQRLRGMGFHLMAQGLPPAGRTLSAEVSALAIDMSIMNVNGAAPPEILRRLQGPHLALGVAAPAAFQQAAVAGCTRFAGEYALHPLPAQQQQGSSRALLLKLLALVTSEADSHAIEMLLKQAPGLSYQLLKLVNSVSFALSKKIVNFGHAITLLGRRQLQRWLQLLLYAQQSGDQRNPLMARAALRASFAEALSKASGGDREEQERAFMAGMFSLLDKLFAMPLEDIVTPLNLAEDVAQAILQRSGRLGALLTIVEQSEHAPAPGCAGQLAAHGLTPTDYCRSLVQACRWTIQVNQDA